MGNADSAAELDPDIKYIDLSNKRLTIVNCHSPETSHISHLYLNGNQIKELPEKLLHLKFLILRKE